MRYRLRYAEEAKHALRTLPGAYRQRIRREIDELGEHPTPAHAEMLRAPLDHYYKITLDQWRLIYQVLEDAGEVWIRRICIKTGPETYEGLAN